MPKTKKYAIPLKEARKLIRVRDQILAEPRKLDMGRLIVTGEDVRNAVAQNLGVWVDTLGTPPGTLFYELHWPLDLLEELSRHRPGTKAYAKVVARRINRYIKKGE